MGLSKRKDQDTMQLRNTVTNDTAHTVPQGVVVKIRSFTNGWTASWRYGMLERYSPYASKLVFWCRRRGP
jgi:hypothetical protein